MSNEALIEYAMNDLRNKAGALGANYIRYDAPQLGVSGGGSGGGVATSTATISGTAYRCARRNGDVGSPKPSGGGGFRFGATPDQAKAICVQAGFQYDAKGTTATCSGTPVELGQPGHVTLTYCASAVCQIDVVLAPPPPSLLDTYRSLRDRLVEKYGRPKSYKKDIDRCHDEAATCVVAGDAWFTYEWRWASQHSVSLLTKAIDGSACVVVSYGTPEIAAEKPGPAL
jgi:hypothetical protein